MDNQSYFVTGPTGSGKTYWAQGKFLEAKVWYENHKDFQMPSITQAIKFYSYPELCMISKSYKMADEIIKELKFAHFAVIDDLWGNNITGFDPIAYIAINARMERNKPTIVTTNMALKDIAKIDDRLASRLHTFQAVVFEGKDLRKSPGKKITITPYENN